MIEVNITQKQRDNLKKLSEYLLKDNLKAEFDMSCYNDSGFSSSLEDHCGTVGCAVGHGPYAGIYKNKGDDWGEYARKSFTSGEGSLYKWCFDSFWVSTDNTPKGAGLRIKWFLEKGIPDDYRNQMFRKSQLCYK